MTAAALALLALVAVTPAEPASEPSPHALPATGQLRSRTRGDDGDLRLGAPLRYRDDGATITVS